MVSDITVPIETLRIPRLRHDRICADEPPDSRIIPPSVEEQQTAAAVLALPGEAEGRRRRAGNVTRRTPGVIAQLGVGAEPIPGAVEGQRRGTEASPFDRAQGRLCLRAQELIARRLAARGLPPSSRPLVLADAGTAPSSASDPRRPGRG